MSVREHTQVHMRRMIARDLRDVLAIEHASSADPWSQDDLLLVLRERRNIGMVSETPERVVGYMVYETCEDRLNVFKFAVAPEHRRRGVGTQMVAKLAGKLGYGRRTKLVLSLRETNLVGQLFLRANGFRATLVSREWYPDTGEDAFTMEYAAAGPPRHEGEV